VILDDPWIVNIEIYTPFYLIVGIKPKFMGSYRDKEKYGKNHHIIKVPTTY